MGTSVGPNRQPPHDLPPHLEIAREAQFVRCVEDEVHTFGAELLDRPPREAGEDASTLVVRIGGGVDRPHGARHPIGTVELPPKQHAEPDDAITVERDPRGRRAERVGPMLPPEEVGVMLVVEPAERGLEQAEHRRLVPSA